jgi:type II secretory pathway component PulF
MGPRLLRSTKVCRSSAAPLLGTATLVSEQQWADFAETLASLLEADTPQDEAVKLAAGALGDSPLRRELQRLPRDAGGETSRRVLISAAAGSPPFLRWALLDAAPSIETPRALRMAAGIYRDSAQRRLQRLAVLAPLVACVVIGGTATLLYGLALFVPVVHMLKAIAS